MDEVAETQRDLAQLWLGILQAPPVPSRIKAHSLALAKRSTSVEVTFNRAGRYGCWRKWLNLEGGKIEYVGTAGMARNGILWDRLRWRMAQIPPQEAWYTAHLQVWPDGRFEFDFNYDDKPDFQGRDVGDIEFLDDQAHFPRPVERLPEWHPARTPEAFAAALAENDQWHMNRAARVAAENPVPDPPKPGL